MRDARSSSVGSSAMHDTDQIKAAMRYHERTKHQFNRYADGPCTASTLTCRATASTCGKR